MKISAINSENHKHNPAFGHSIRVTICAKPLGLDEYEFISPAKNSKLYKQLNSKIVGWLNEDFITKLRKDTGFARRTTKKLSENDAYMKERLIDELKDIDSDYRNLNVVRSVYDRYHLGVIATGIDVPIIENMMGATQLGKAKKMAKTSLGALNELVDKMRKAFHNNSKLYANDPVQQLRSSNGKEIMLKLNFNEVGTNRHGKSVYELDNYDFYEVQKSIPLNAQQRELYKEKYEKGAYDQLVKLIKHYIDGFANSQQKASKIANQYV